MNRNPLLLFPRNNNNNGSGGLPPNELEDIRMNWVSIFSEDIRMNWKTYECIGIHTMNWGSAFFGGKTYE